MGGIYLHIPFCRQACSYCDFHFSTNLSHTGELVAALLAEARLRDDFFPDGESIDTIYFGGGTPSLLPVDDLRRILERLQSDFPIGPEPEITLEGNPDDLNPDTLSKLRAAGINRLSIGIQSFHDDDLSLMRRFHNAEQAASCLTNARAAKFDNISLDLIYGIPGADMDRWRRNVERAIAHEPEHISAYALTVEPQTLLHHQVQKQKVVLPEDDAYQEQFFFLIDALEAAGYEHYELSNFARPGYRSRHNSAYWNGVPYLGLGPSAHSFLDNIRSWNISNNARYLRSLLDDGTRLFEDEKLSPRDQLNEYLMTHLRKAEGIDLGLMQNKWGFDLLGTEADAVARFAGEGWLYREGGNLRLTRTGKMVSDAIIRAFFQVEDEATTEEIR